MVCQRECVTEYNIGELSVVKIANIALERLEIDELGLDNTDRRMLETIIKFYDGGPVGLDTIAASIGEESNTIEDVCEPYLLQMKLQGQCSLPFHSWLSL